VVALAVQLRLPGLRTRLGGAGAPPRNVIRGDAVRLVGLVGMLSHAGSAVVGLGMLLWLNGSLPMVPPPPALWNTESPAGWWPTVTIFASLLWLPAYLALLFGQRTVARLLAVVALGTGMVVSVLRFEPDAPFVFSDLAFLAFTALPVLALVAFHRDAPRVRPGPWLIALAVTVAVEASSLLTWPADPGTFPILDWPATVSVMLVAAALVHFAMPGRTPAWSLALALLGAVAFGLRLLTLMDYAHAASIWQRDTLIVFGLVEIGAVAAVTVPLAILADRALRRLPAVSSAA